jgi:hypothetical protein
MLVTLVVRLVPEKLAAGEFVGEVEHVGDGRHELVRTVGDLVAFAQRAAEGDPDDGPRGGGARGSR